MVLKANRHGTERIKILSQMLKRVHCTAELRVGKGNNSLDKILPD